MGGGLGRGVEAFEASRPDRRHQDVDGFANQRLLALVQAKILEDGFVEGILDFAVAAALIEFGQIGELLHIAADPRERRFSRLRIGCRVDIKEGEGFDIGKMDAITFAEHLPAAHHEKVTGELGSQINRGELKQRRIFARSGNDADAVREGGRAVVIDRADRMLQFREPVREKHARTVEDCHHLIVKADDRRLRLRPWLQEIGMQHGRTRTERRHRHEPHLAQPTSAHGGATLVMEMNAFAIDPSPEWLWPLPEVAERSARRQARPQSHIVGITPHQRDEKLWILGD